MSLNNTAKPFPSGLHRCKNNVADFLGYWNYFRGVPCSYMKTSFEALPGKII